MHVIDRQGRFCDRRSLVFLSIVNDFYGRLLSAKLPLLA